MSPEVGTYEPVKISEEDKKWIHDELARIKKECRAAIRKKRNKTRKVWTGVWKHVNWSRK